MARVRSLPCVRAPFWWGGLVGGGVGVWVCFSWGVALGFSFGAGGAGLGGGWGVLLGGGGAGGGRVLGLAVGAVGLVADRRRLAGIHGRGCHLGRLRGPRSRSVPLGRRCVLPGGYPFLVAGLAIAVGDRRPVGVDLRALLDAGLLTVIAGLLAWVFIIQPVSDRSRRTAVRLDRPRSPIRWPISHSWPSRRGS